MALEGALADLPYIDIDQTPGGPETLGQPDEREVGAANGGVENNGEEGDVAEIGDDTAVCESFTPPGKIPGPNSCIAPRMG